VGRPPAFTSGRHHAPQLRLPRRDTPLDRGVDRAMNSRCVLRVVHSGWWLRYSSCARPARPPAFSAKRDALALELLLGDSGQAARCSAAAALVCAVPRPAGATSFCESNWRFRARGAGAGFGRLDLRRPRSSHPARLRRRRRSRLAMFPVPSLQQLGFGLRPILIWPAPGRCPRWWDPPAFNKIALFT